MTTCRCPHCGGKIELSPVGKAQKSAGRQTMTLMQSSHRTVFKNEAASVSAGYQSESQSPVFLPTTGSHVVVPFLQAVITGAFIAVPVALVVGLSDFEIGRMSFRGDLGSGFLWGSVSFFGVTLLRWISQTGEFNSLLWKFETVTGLDANNDNEIGQPVQPHKIRVEVEHGQRWQFEDLPGDARSLYKFAADVSNGRVTFSESGARDSGYGSANYAALRDAFINHGWAEWKNPNNRQLGVTVHRNGRSVLKAIASDPPPAVMSDRGDDGQIGMSPHYVEKGTGRGSWG